jgi:hypothetical protein
MPLLFESLKLCTTRPALGQVHSMSDLPASTGVGAAAAAAPAAGATVGGTTGAACVGGVVGGVVGVDPRGRDSMALESIEPLRTGADCTPAASGVVRGAVGLGAAGVAGRAAAPLVDAGAAPAGEPGDVRETIGAGGPLEQPPISPIMTTIRAPARQ